MPLITDIKQQKNNSERLNIYLDGKYAFATSLDVFARFSLKKGKDLDEETIKEIVDEESYVKNLSKVLDYISYKLRTKKEIEDKINSLLYKNIKSTKLRGILKEKILNRIIEMGLIDDLSYAKTFIEQKMQSKKPASRGKLAEFLFKKGIDRKIIDDVLSEISEDKQLEGALSLARKKLKSLEKYDKRVKKQKLWRYLASRGYNSSIIATAVDTTLNL